MRPDSNSRYSQKGRKARMKTGMPMKTRPCHIEKWTERIRLKGGTNVSEILNQGGQLSPDTWRTACEGPWAAEQLHSVDALVRDADRSYWRNLTGKFHLSQWTKEQVQSGFPNKHIAGRDRDPGDPKTSVAVTTEENIASSLTEQAISECTLKSKPFSELELREQ